MSFINYFTELHKRGLIEDSEFEELKNQYNNLTDEKKAGVDADCAERDIEKDIKKRIFESKLKQLKPFQQFLVRSGGFIGLLVTFVLCVIVLTLLMSINLDVGFWIFIPMLGAYTLGEKYFQDKYINKPVANTDNSQKKKKKHYTDDDFFY